MDVKFNSKEYFIREIEHVDNDEDLGYIVTIKTKDDKSEKKIKALICNDRQCCEEWGVLTTHENLDEFIGAQILSANTTPTDKALSNIDKELDIGEQERKNLIAGDHKDIRFITIETNHGTIQFTAYTYHNGYCGHAADISIEDK